MHAVLERNQQTLTDLNRQMLQIKAEKHKEKNTFVMINSRHCQQFPLS